MPVNDDKLRQNYCLLVLICSAAGFKYVLESEVQYLIFLLADLSADCNIPCGVQVLEIQPAIARHKGKAVNFLLESLGKDT